MLESKAFTYAGLDNTPLEKLFIRAIEKMTGQAKIYRLYREYKQEKAAYDNFWDAALCKLDLTLNYDREKLEAMPRSGPLVVVANHPYGVLDGVILTHLLYQVRRDFRVLTNSVLCKEEDANEFLLPVDFTGTDEALETNLQTRAAARRLLKEGGAIGVFPAGGVANIPHWRAKTAVDAPWQPFIARLVMESQAAVMPVFFEGQNSRLFQWASLCSQTLRLSLLFKELADRTGSPVGIQIGEPVPYRDLAHIKGRALLCAELQRRTYALGRRHP